MESSGSEKQARLSFTDASARSAEMNASALCHVSAALQAGISRTLPAVSMEKTTVRAVMASAPRYMRAGLSNSRSLFGSPTCQTTASAREYRAP